MSRSPGSLCMTLRTIFITLILVMLLNACSEPSPHLPHLDEDAVILAFGDSLTRGNGTSEENSYPAVLQRLSGRLVINAGVSGEVSRSGLKRLPEILDEYHPQLLILCHGGNDMLRHSSMTELQSNLKKMIELSQNRNIPVVLIGVPRPALFGLESAPPYVALSHEMNLPFESTILPEVLSKKEYKSDQIHPNAEGYRIIAEAVYRLMKESGAL